MNFKSNWKPSLFNYLIYFTCATMESSFYSILLHMHFKNNSKLSFLIIFSHHACDNSHYLCEICFFIFLIVYYGNEEWLQAWVFFCCLFFSSSFMSFFLNKLDHISMGKKKCTWPQANRKINFLESGQEAQILFSTSKYRIDHRQWNETALIPIEVNLVDYFTVASI